MLNIYKRFFEHRSFSSYRVMNSNTEVVKQVGKVRKQIGEVIGQVCEVVEQVGEISPALVVEFGRFTLN